MATLCLKQKRLGKFRPSTATDQLTTVRRHCGEVKNAQTILRVETNHRSANERTLSFDDKKRHRAGWNRLTRNHIRLRARKIDKAGIVHGIRCLRSWRSTQRNFLRRTARQFLWRLRRLCRVVHRRRHFGPWIAGRTFDRRHGWPAGRWRRNFRRFANGRIGHQPTRLPFSPTPFVAIAGLLKSVHCKLNERTGKWFQNRAKCRVLGAFPAPY